MERLGYTRLYATVTGILLVLIGLFGFLVSAEFKTPSLTDDMLGTFAVNGWTNSLHVIAGLLALVLARRFSRLYAAVGGLGFLALGFWGILAADGHLLAGKLPADRATNLLNLALGLLGLLALVASYGEDIAGDFRTRLEKRRKRHDARRRRRRIRKTGRKRKSQAPPRPRKPSVSERMREEG